LWEVAQGSDDFEEFIFEDISVASTLESVLSVGNNTGFNDIQIDGGQSIVFETSGSNPTIYSSGASTINIDDGTSSNSVQLDGATGQLTLTGDSTLDVNSGGQMFIDASGPIDITGVGGVDINTTGAPITVITNGGSILLEAEAPVIIRSISSPNNLVSPIGTQFDSDIAMSDGYDIIFGAAGSSGVPKISSPGVNELTITDGASPNLVELNGSTGQLTLTSAGTFDVNAGGQLFIDSTGVMDITGGGGVDINTTGAPITIVTN
jgi:hypothetical protein